MSDTIHDPSDRNDPHTTVEVHWAPIPEAVLYDPSLGDKAVRIYGTLMRHGLDPRSCYPSHARIADLVGCSKRSVQRPLVELEAAGWIERVPRWTDGHTISRDRSAARSAGWERTSDGFHVRTSRAPLRGVRAGERVGSAHESADVRAPERGKREQENESNGTREPSASSENGGARRAGSSETDLDTARAFTEFWDSWTPTGTRGKGPKKAAQERFTKLGPKLRERMLATTRGYLAMCEAEQRATVDCATWLGTSDKSWRAWEDEFAAEPVTIRDDFATLPPAEWTAEERALVARQAAERPPDMWEPAVLRLLMHERPDGTQVRNTLGSVPFPPASDTPGVTADDGTLMAWWAERTRRQHERPDGSGDQPPGLPARDSLGDGPHRP